MHATNAIKMFHVQTCQVLKNIMREAGTRISRLALNAEMWPSAQVRVFCRGRGASSPRKFYIFYLGKCYLKQQITPGLGKTKGDISEIHIRCTSIDLDTNRRIFTIIFWLTHLHEAKKRGNVALRKVENIHCDRKYKSEKQ